MTIGAEIYSRLTNHAGLSALVSTRVHTGRLPQNVTYPAVRYTLVSEERDSAMGSDTGVVRSRWQFDVYAEREVTATVAGVSVPGTRNTADQLRQALQRWTTSSGVIVQDTFIGNVSEINEAEFDLDGTGEGRPRIMMEAEIIYEE